MFKSVCIFARMVCASSLNFLDGKICAIQEPSIIIKTNKQQQAKIIPNSGQLFTALISSNLQVYIQILSLDHIIVRT